MADPDSELWSGMPGTEPTSARKRKLVGSIQSHIRPRKRTADRPVERTKTSRACDACKRRKTKCSGALPCVRCRQLTIACEYTAVYTRGRLPAIQVASDVPNTTGARAAVPHPRQGSPETRFDEVSPCHSAVPNIDVNGQYHGPSSPLTFLECAWTQLKNTDKESHVSAVWKELDAETRPDKPSPYRYNLSWSQGLPCELAVLPSRHCANLLVERYFEMSTPFYRFLHQGTIENWMTAVYQGSNKSTCLLRGPFAGKSAVLLMIFAEATAREDCKDDESRALNEQSASFYGHACHILQHDTGTPNLESVQARLAECFYLLSTPRANEAYSKFGVLVSMAITIGLHRKKRHHGYKHEIGLVEHECRKRAFWAVYILDRYLSVMGGRPRLIQDYDHDQEFPAALNDEALALGKAELPRVKRPADSIMEAANAQAELARIIGRASHEIYSLTPCALEDHIARVQCSTRALGVWERALPVLLRDVSPSSLSPLFRRQCVLIRIAQAHAIIHANRPFLLRKVSCRTSHASDCREDLTACIHNCVDAALSVLETLECLTEEDTGLYSMWLVQYVSFCAIAVIYIFVMVQRQQQDVADIPVAKSPGLSELSINDIALKERVSAAEISAAEKWQKRLAMAARQNTPGEKYNLILEELQREVERHGASLKPCIGAPTPLANRDSLQGQGETSSAGISSQIDFQGMGHGDVHEIAEDSSANTHFEISQILDNWGLPEWVRFD